jgi:hypothetical protein
MRAARRKPATDLLATSFAAGGKASKLASNESPPLEDTMPPTEFSISKTLIAATAVAYAAQTVSVQSAFKTLTQEKPTAQSILNAPSTSEHQRALKPDPAKLEPAPEQRSYSVTSKSV